MSDPTNYFYDGQVRRYVSQFIRLVSNFYVEFGKDANGVTALQRVPVIYGDQGRQAATILRNNSENATSVVPAMAVYISDLKFDQSRLQDPSLVNTMQLRQREFDPVTGTYTHRQGDSLTVERLMPVPYKLSLKLDIWTSSTEQKLQLIEQLAPLFRPALEIQSTDNYIDWTGLSYVLLTDNTWTSRSVPTGGEEPIDITTFNFELPIWISTSAKVKRMGVIQTIIANFQELPDYTPLDMKLISLLNYGINVATDPSGVITIKLLKSQEIINQETYIESNKHSWQQLLDEYGGFRSGSSQIRLTQANESEIVGTIAFHPTDYSLLLYTPFIDTMPANTLAPINAIIDPMGAGVAAILQSPATGTRYLLLDDIGSTSNDSGAVAWRGTDNQDLVAHANDIVEFDGIHWTVSFDSQQSDVLNYATNLTTGVQYKWEHQQWTKSYDGVYPGGHWGLAI